MMSAARAGDDDKAETKPNALVATRRSLVYNTHGRNIVARESSKSWEYLRRRAVVIRVRVVPRSIHDIIQRSLAKLLERAFNRPEKRFPATEKIPLDDRTYEPYDVYYTHLPAYTCVRIAFVAVAYYYTWTFIVAFIVVLHKYTVRGVPWRRLHNGIGSRAVCEFKFVFAWNSKHYDVGLRFYIKKKKLLFIIFRLRDILISY